MIVLVMRRAISVLLLCVTGTMWLSAGRPGTVGAAGTVTVGTGGNLWAGGENSVPYGLVIFLPGSTVTLDGKPIVESGVLKL